MVDEVRRASLGCMNALNIDTLYTPLYLCGLVTSAALLGLLRQREYAAEKAELVPHFDPKQRMFLCRRSHRVRLGVAPLLSLGRPGTARFLSPTFLLSEVLPREPMSLIPFMLSWLFLLADAPGWAAIAVIVGVAWRAVVDAVLLPKSWSSEERIETIKVKIAWCLLSGVWGASIAVYVWAVLIALMVVLAMCAAAATKSRRSKW